MSRRSARSIAVSSSTTQTRGCWPTRAVAARVSESTMRKVIRPRVSPKRSADDRDGPIGSWSYAPRPRLGRQLDVSRDPPVGVAGHPDPSTVRVDDRPADRQPHAEPSGLGGDEGLEDALELRLLQAGAGIADRHLDAQSRALAGRDDQIPRAVDDRHRLARIDQQVEDHLLELDAVTGHRGQSRRTIERHRDAPSLDVVPDEARHRP